MSEGELRPADLDAPGTPPPPKPRGPKIPWIVAAAVLLLGLALIGFLGRRPFDPPAPRPAPTPLAPADPDARAAAEAAREAWLRLQRDLRPARADLWAPEEHAALQSAREQAERSMAARRFAGAKAEYRELVRLAEPLLDRGPRDAPEPLMKAAVEHYAEGNADAAVERLRALLFLVPGHPDATDLLPRARRAEQTLADLSRARAALHAGEPDLAHVHVERAHAADPRFPGLAETRQTIRQQLAGQEAAARFNRAASALENGDPDLAAENVAQGLALRPDHPRGLELQSRVQDIQTHRRVDQLRREAETAERGEDWERAHRRWLEIQSLAPDTDGLDPALERTREHRLLRERLTRALGALNSTFAEETVAALRNRDLDDLPSGLSADARKLVDTWTLHHTPVTVRLTSDGETRVTLLRVGRLGTFVETTRDLKPGTYTAVGERLGHRDVRVTFTVPPGGDLPPVDIRATEGITGGAN